LPRRPKTIVLSRKEIGQRVKALRLEKGMTQVELAAAAGTQQTSLSQIERGVRGAGVPQVVKLARALGVPADRLLSSAKPVPSSRNEKLLRRVRQVESLPAEHQGAVVQMLDAFLKTHRTSNGRR
jgi:transcriptional regulator with XRE-family HTH domain